LIQGFQKVSQVREARLLSSRKSMEKIQPVGLLLLALYWVAVGGEEIDAPVNKSWVSPFPTNSGAVLIPEGTAVFTSNTWNLVIDLPLHSLRRDLRTLASMAHQWNLTGSYIFEDHSALASLIAETQQAFEELAEMTPYVDVSSKNTGNSSTKGLRRRRRGWVNAIGNAMWTMFGTATDQDLQQVREKVDGLGSSNTALVHSFNDQLSILKQINEHANKEDQRITSTVEAVKALQNVSDKLYQQVSQNSAAVKHATRLAVYSQLVSALNYFRNRITELHVAQHKLRMGYLDSNFIHPATLLSILEVIEKRIPDRFDMIQKPELKNMRAYYQWQICTEVPTLDAIRALVRIPLATADEAFEVYNVIPFPTYSKFRRMALHDIEAKIAVSPDRTKFTPLPRDVTANCITGSTLICPQNHAYLTKPSEHCMYGMIMNQNVTPSRRCVYGEIPHPRPIIASLSPVQWAISTAQTETITLLCMKNLSGVPDQLLAVEDSISVTGNTLLHLPLHCMARAETWEIPLRLNTIGSSSMSIPTEAYLTPSFPAEFDLINGPNSEIDNATILHLMEITRRRLNESSQNHTLDFERIQEAYDNFRERFNFKQYDHDPYWQTRDLLQSVGSALGMLAILCGFLWCLRSIYMSRKVRMLPRFQPSRSIVRSPEIQSFPLRLMTREAETAL